MAPTSAARRAAVDDAVPGKAREAREPGIVEHAQVEHQPVALAVLGQHREAAPHRLGRRGEARVPAVEPHRPRIGGPRAEDRLGDLGAAAADEAEHADDLAGAHREAHVLEAAPLAEPLHLQHHAAGLAAALGEDRRQRPPDHGADDPVVVELGHRRGQHARAVLEHDDLVGDLEDLLQPVRDVEDGPAGSGEAPDLGEELRGLRGREHRGRLVEDQDARLGDQRLGDLDDLLARDAQAPDRGGRVEIGKAEIRKHPPGDPVGFAPVDDEGQAAASASGRAARSRRR